MSAFSKARDGLLQDIGGGVARTGEGKREAASLSSLAEGLIVEGKKEREQAPPEKLS